SNDPPPVLMFIVVPPCPMTGEKMRTLSGAVSASLLSDGLMSMNAKSPTRSPLGPKVATPPPVGTFAGLQFCARFQLPTTVVPLLIGLWKNGLNQVPLAL